METKERITRLEEAIARLQYRIEQQDEEILKLSDMLESLLEEEAETPPTPFPEPYQEPETFGTEM